jgi:hypothetical protein
VASKMENEKEVCRKVVERGVLYHLLEVIPIVNPRRVLRCHCCKSRWFQQTICRGNECVIEYRREKKIKACCYSSERGIVKFAQKE